MLMVIDSTKNEVENNDVKDWHRFNKTAGAEKIYERREYIILRVKKGYVVYNTKKDSKMVILIFRVLKCQRLLLTIV